MVAVAFALVVDGTLFKARVQEAVHVTHNSLLDSFKASSMNPVTKSNCIGSIKISSETGEEKPALPYRTYGDDSTVITLQSGQTLWELSFRYLGWFNPEVTQRIQMLNPEIKDPGAISAGTQVRLPAPSGVFDRSTSFPGEGSSLEANSR